MNVDDLTKTVEQARTRVRMLERQVKVITGSGPVTMADLEGIWEGLDISDEEIEASKIRFGKPSGQQH